MMAEPVKFMFDRNLDPNHTDEQEPETIDLAVHETMLEKARAQAFAEGVAEGRRQAAAEADQRFAEKADTIAGALTRNLEAIDEAVAENVAAAAELAMVIARTLAPNLIAREPTREMEELLRDCVHHLRSIPHLVVRVNDALVEIAKKRLEPVAAQTGHDGRLIILGEPDISVGDCRIEWAEGSIVREISAIDQTVRDKVKQYLAAGRADRKGKTNG